MSVSSSQLKNRAKINLQGVYGQSVATALIYSLITTVISAAPAGITVFSTAYDAMRSGSFNIQFNAAPLSSVGSIAAFLLAGPLMVGLARYFLNVSDKKDPQLTDLFSHFKDFTNTLVMYVLTMLYTFLWALLFIIPGIIAGIGYAMAPYILAEHPEIKASDALKMSKNMMKGHKGEYFCLLFSFIGWYILCLFTAGIGYFFLLPYIETAKAEFFNEISGKNYEKTLNTDGGSGSFGFQPEI